MCKMYRKNENILQNNVIILQNKGKKNTVLPPCISTLHFQHYYVKITNAVLKRMSPSFES